MSDGLMTTKETFQTYGVDQKLNTLFDFVEAIHHTACTQRQEDEKRFRKLENRKLTDKGIAAISGAIGGFVAVALKRLTGLF